MSVPRLLAVALVALFVASTMPAFRGVDATTQGVQGAETGSPYRYRWVDSAAPGCLAPNFIGSGIPVPHSAQDPAKGCPLGWDEIANENGCKMDVGWAPPPGSSGDNRAALSTCIATLPVNFFWLSGITYSSANIYIQENGLVQFGSTAANCCGLNSRVPRHLPTAGSPNNMLAAYWTNLHAFDKDYDSSELVPEECWDVPDGPSLDFGHIWASKAVQGTFPFRYVVIEWDRVLLKEDDADYHCLFANEGSNRYATFQVKLYLDLGTVDVIWKDAIPYDEQALSLGIVNGPGSWGLSYCSPTVFGQCDEGSVPGLQDRAIRYYRSQMIPLSGSVTINEDCTSIVVQPGADTCSAVHPSNFAWNPDYGEPDHPPGARFCIVTSPSRGSFVSANTCGTPNTNPMVYTPYRNYNGDGSFAGLGGPNIERYAYRVQDWETATISPLTITCTPLPTLPQVGCVSITINPVDDPPRPRPTPPATERFNVVSGDSIYILPTITGGNGVALGHYDPEMRNGWQFNTVHHARNAWYCTPASNQPAADPLGCFGPPPVANDASMREMGQQRAFYDGATEAGLTKFTSMSAKFNLYDKDAFIFFPGAPNGLRIVSIQSPTTVTLSTAMTTTMTELPFVVDRPNISVWVGPECPGYSPAWLPLHGAITASDPITGATRTGIALDGGFLFTADVYTGADTFRYCVYDGEKYSLTPGTVRMNIVPPNPGWMARSDEYSMEEGAGNVVATGPNAPAANDESSLCTSGLTYTVVDPALGPPNAYSFTWDPPTSRFSYSPYAEWASDDAFWYRMTCAPRTVNDATYTGGSSTVTSAAADFSALDLGAAITGSGIPAGATITAVNPPAATISAPTTGASVAGANVVITPQSNVASIRLRVVPVNDQPFIEDWMGYGDTIYEDNGLIGAMNQDNTPAPPPAPFNRYVPKMITGISPGDGWEESRSQSLRVVIESVSNPGLFTSTIPCPNNYSWATTVCPAPQLGPAMTLLGPAGKQTASLSYTTAPDAFGISQVCFRIQDNGGTAEGGQDMYPAPDEDPLCFHITIVPVNDRPRPVADAYTIYRNLPLTAPKNEQLWPVPLPAVQDLLTKGVADADVDGDTMKTFLYSGPTAGGSVAYVNTDGSFRYTPPANQPATPASPPYVDTFRYWVKDSNGQGSGPTTVTITVLWNAKPVATITRFAWADTTLPQPYVGDTITAEGTCTDTDNEPLFLLWDFGDGFTSLDASTTHVYGAPGEYTVALRCYDTRGDVGAAFHNVTVRAFNTGGGYDGTGNPDDYTEAPALPPLTVNAGLDMPVVETRRVELLGTASEPEVDTWVWTQVAGPTAILVNNTKQDAWFYAPALEGGKKTSVTFSLVATKGARTSAPALVTYEVRPENTAPVSRPEAPRMAYAGERIDLKGSASSDEESESLSFKWTAPGFDSGIADATAADTTFTVPEESLGNVITFSLEVSDGVMASIDSVQVQVVPKTYSGEGFTAEVAEDGTVTLTPVAPGVRFLWDFGDQSQETSTGATTHRYERSGTYTVWLTAVDADGQELSFREAVPVAVGVPDDGQHGVSTGGGSLSGSPSGGMSSLAWWLIAAGVLLAIALVVATLVIMRRKR